METTQREITDMERCAVTLLAQRNPSDPFLIEWKHRIQTELDYAVFFYHFQPSPDAASFATAYRRSTPKELHEILRGGRFHKDADPSYTAPERNFWLFHLRLDEATEWLGNAIVSHRKWGQADGDRMTDIRYGDSTIAVVINSLASEVVTYVRMIENAWATYA